MLLYILSLINLEFSVYFVKDVYSYEEGDSGAEVCLEGSGETAQPVTVEVSSYVEGTATGTYIERTFIICAMCQKRGGNRCWCLISVLINLSSLYNNIITCMHGLLDK